jgi:hypothetical protein
VEGHGTLTAGIPHKTQGHALVFAAVWAKGDCYPARSWSLARPVGVLYALQKAKPKKKLFGAGPFALVERTTYFSVQSRALFSRCPVCKSDEMMEVEVRERSNWLKRLRVSYESRNAISSGRVPRSSRSHEEGWTGHGASDMPRK